MHKDQLGNKTPYIGFEYPQCREGTIILAPLSENPNAPNKHGVTPFAVAKRAEIRGILEPFETSRKCKKKHPLSIFLSKILCLDAN